MFNEKGTDQVSSLQISQALGISYGNLTYHFKNKEAIVLALYQELEQFIEAALAKTIQHLYERTFYLGLINNFFEITWKYRFIYLNLNSLMSQYSVIGTTQKEYTKRRNKLLNKVKDDLIKEGYLQSATYIDYQLTIHNLSLIFYTWILDAQLFYKGKERSKIEYYTRLFYNIVMPILTAKGRKKMNALRTKAIQ